MDTFRSTRNESRPWLAVCCLILLANCEGVAEAPKRTPAASGKNAVQVPRLQTQVAPATTTMGKLTAEAVDSLSCTNRSSDLDVFLMKGTLGLRKKFSTATWPRAVRDTGLKRLVRDSDSSPFIEVDAEREKAFFNNPSVFRIHKWRRPLDMNLKDKQLGKGKKRGFYVQFFVRPRAHAPRKPQAPEFDVAMGYWAQLEGVTVADAITSDAFLSSAILPSVLQSLVASDALTSRLNLEVLEVYYDASSVTWRHEFEPGYCVDILLSKRSNRGDSPSYMVVRYRVPLLGTGQEAIAVKALSEGSLQFTPHLVGKSPLLSRRIPYFRAGAVFVTLTADHVTETMKKPLADAGVIDAASFNFPDTDRPADATSPAVLRRMKRTVIPEVQLETATIGEVLAFLEEASVEYYLADDLPILFDAVSIDHRRQGLSLNARGVTIYGILGMLAELHGLTWAVQDGVVILRPIREQQEAGEEDRTVSQNHR